MSYDKRVPTFEKLHGPPLTRRDLLKCGLLQFSTVVTLPSLVTLLGLENSEAQSSQCPKTSTGLCPFITLNLTGGAALAGNYIPFDASGELLESYSVMGLGSKSSVLSVAGTSDPIFQPGPLFSGASQIRNGIIGSSQRSTRQKSAFVAINVRLMDDSRHNPFDCTGEVARAGLVGAILPNLGKQNTSTGINMTPAFVRPLKPLVVSSFDDLVSAIGVGGSLNQLTRHQKSKMFALVRDLSVRQSRSLASMTGGDVLSKLVECATGSNANLLSSAPPDLSPLQDPAFSAVWGINAESQKSSQDFVFASMVYNAIRGHAGTVSLSMGGYDYHDNTRSSGDLRDREAGIVIAKILESFAVMNVKGALFVNTDGSVSSVDSSEGGSPWRSDRGLAGCGYMLFFDPIKRPDTSRGFQVNHFTKFQAADADHIVGSSPQKAAMAVFANYLSFNKRLDMFEKIAPRIFTAAELDSQILKVA